MRACQEFNLTLNSYDDETSDFGLWDGQQFLVTVSFSLKFAILIFAYFM